jgi:hypothetical protein
VSVAQRQGIFQEQDPRLELCDATVVRDTGRLFETELTSPPCPAGVEKHRLHRQGHSQREYLYPSSLHNEERRPEAPLNGLR